MLFKTYTVKKQDLIVVGTTRDKHQITIPQYINLILSQINKGDK